MLTLGAFCVRRSVGSRIRGAIPGVRCAIAISGFAGQVGVMVGNFQVPSRISERG